MGGNCGHEEPLFFKGYEVMDIPVERGTIRARAGGSGPPLLLLHGYPETHLMWHGTADALAQRYTVIAADLPGYGDSLKPITEPGHAPHSKRAMAIDLIQAMAAMGHERFFVAGHDRGGRVAYRMALDHPCAVSRLAVLDIVPTGEVWARADAALTLAYWHWGLLAAPAPMPEAVLGGPKFFDNHMAILGIRGASRLCPADILDAYRRQFSDPGTVTGICEDYRAGATIDRRLDDQDRSAGRSIQCPTLVLWAESGSLPRLYGDVLALWSRWAPDVAGEALLATHFLVEDQPDQVAAALIDFLE